MLRQRLAAFQSRCAAFDADLEALLVELAYGQDVDADAPPQHTFAAGRGSALYGDTNNGRRREVLPTGGWIDDRAERHRQTETAIGDWRAGLRRTAAAAVAPAPARSSSLLEEVERCDYRSPVRDDDRGFPGESPSHLPLLTPPHATNSVEVAHESRVDTGATAARSMRAADVFVLVHRSDSHRSDASGGGAGSPRFTHTSGASSTTATSSESHSSAQSDSQDDVADEEDGDRGARADVSVTHALFLQSQMNAVLLPPHEAAVLLTEGSSAAPRPATAEELPHEGDAAVAAHAPSPDGVAGRSRRNSVVTGDDAAVRRSPSDPAAAARRSPPVHAAAPPAHRDANPPTPAAAQPAPSSPDTTGSASARTAESDIAQPQPMAVSAAPPSRRDGGAPELPRVDGVGAHEGGHDGDDLPRFEREAAALLASGVWKAKTDPRGRTYYVNKVERVTVWNLAKELRRRAGGG